MKTFMLKISSPDGDVFSGNIVKLSVRGTEGELAVMAGHVPFVTYVNPGECKIEFENGNEKTAYIQSGVLTVSKNKVVLISGDPALKFD